MRLHTLAGAAAVLAMAIGSMAGAQTWQTPDGNYTTVFQGCSRTDANNVKCILSVASATDQNSVQFTDSNFKVVGPDGTEYPLAGAIAGSKNANTGYGYFTTPMYAGLPVKLTLSFPYPAVAGSTIARLKTGSEGHILSNVPLGGMQVVRAAPTPAPTGMQVVRAGVTYNAAMTGCTTTGNTITCAKTVLTPAR